MPDGKGQAELKISGIVACGWSVGEKGKGLVAGT